MPKKPTRRSVLKSFSLPVGVGVGATALTSDTKASPGRNNHEVGIDPDLMVKNNGREGRTIRVRVDPVGSKKSKGIHKSLDIPSVAEVSPGVDGPPVDRLNMNIGGGNQRIIIEDEFGNSDAFDIDIPAGGLEDNSLIILSRNPDHTFSIYRATV